MKRLCVLISVLTVLLSTNEDFYVGMKSCLLAVMFTTHPGFVFVAEDLFLSLKSFIVAKTWFKQTYTPKCLLQ